MFNMFLGFNVKGALDYAFLNKKTRKTLFLFIGIQLAIVAFTILMILPTLIPIIGIIFACCLYFVMLVLPFILAVYDSAARYEVMQSILEDKPIPDLTTNFSYLIKEGLKIIFLRLIAGIVAMIPLFIVIIIYVFLTFIAIGAGAFLIQDQSPFGIIMFLLLILILEYPFIFIVNGVASAIIEPVVYYYIKNGRKLENVNKLDNIMDIIKTSWKKFFALSFIITLINFVQFLFILPSIIILFAGVGANLVIVVLIGFFLFLITLIPMIIFNTGFNALAYPHLLSQIFKKYS